MEGKELIDSNISFFEYSFMPLIDYSSNEKNNGDFNYKIQNGEAISWFKNILTQKQQFQYEPRQKLWYMCITDFEKIIDGNACYLFATLNKMSSRKRERIFDWNEYKEKETEVKNVIEGKWNFVIIPDNNLIVNEYSERFSSELFKNILVEIWNQINSNKPKINLIEKTETWNYAKILRSFDKISEINFKNVPYPNPIVGNSIEEGKQWLKRLRASKLDDLKLTGEIDAGLNAGDILLASLGVIAERKNGNYKGIGVKNGRQRTFHSGTSKITDKIKYKKENKLSFLSAIKDSIDRLFR